MQIQTQNTLIQIISNALSEIVISVNDFIYFISNKYFWYAYLAPLHEISVQMLFQRSKIIWMIICNPFRLKYTQHYIHF